jgi:hypothetical protein
MPAAKLPGAGTRCRAPATNQSGQITPPPVSATPAPAAMAPGAGPAPTPKPAAGGNFRETLWFKKGDVDQMVAEARQRVEAARAKGIAVPDPEGEVAAAVAAEVEAGPLDERYVDDGSVTTDDRKKFSLRSGATSTALPTVGGAIPGERMSDAEVMAEVGGKKRIAIIAIAVAIVALLGICVWNKLKAKDVAKNAAALTPTEIPTQRRRPKGRRRRLLPRRPSLRPSRRRGGRKDADEPTPKAARTRRREEARARQGAKAKGKKPTSSAGRRCRPVVAVELRWPRRGPPQSGDPQSRDRLRDRVDRGARVDGHGLRIAGDELAIGGGDAFLDRVGVVAFLAAAGGVAARRRDRHRQVEQQGQVRGTHLARQLGDPPAFRLLSLIRQRRQQVAVADHVDSRRQRRLYLAAQVVAPIGGEQQRHRAPIRGAAVGETVPAEQDLAQQAAHRSGAGLARRVNAAAARGQVAGEAVELGRGPRAVDTFEHDEEGRRHLRKTLPRSTRFWAWREGCLIWGPAKGGALTLILLAAAVIGCPRDRNRSSAPNASTANLDARDVRCVERPEGCVWCEGRGPMPPLVEPDAVPASLCDPKDDGNCVEFCSRLAPECAVPWRTVPTCLLPSEQEFRREIIRRDTADRPEAHVQGRVTDEAGRRIEGAKISVWLQGTSVAEEVSGKDGTFHLRLRTGPWTYFVRVSRAALATEIADLRVEKPGTTQRTFRLAPENVIRGRVVSNKGEPIRGATVHAVRNAEDPVASGEAQSADDGTFALGGLDSRRYFLRASKFGWLPETLKWTVTAPAKGVGFKLARTGVIEGRVVDSDGDGQANATVVALLSAGLGATASPIIWRVDSEGASRRTVSRRAPTTCGPATARCWCIHPRRSRSATRSWTRRSS